MSIVKLDEVKKAVDDGNLSPEDASMILDCISKSITYDLLALKLFNTALKK